MSLDKRFSHTVISLESDETVELLGCSAIKSTAYDGITPRIRDVSVLK
jgi:hypothetical protein